MQAESPLNMFTQINREKAKAAVSERVAPPYDPNNLKSIEFYLANLRQLRAEATSNWVSEGLTVHIGELEQRISDLSRLLGNRG